MYVFEKFYFTSCFIEFGAVYAGAESRELDFSVRREYTPLHLQSSMNWKYSSNFFWYPISSPIHFRQRFFFAWRIFYPTLYCRVNIRKSCMVGFFCSMSLKSRRNMAPVQPVLQTGYHSGDSYYRHSRTLEIQSTTDCMYRLFTDELSNARYFMAISIFTLSKR